MPRSRVVVGVVGLLFGGLLASIFVLGCQRQPAVAGPDPAVHKRFPLNGTDDSPVLARGGSMEFLSGNQWNPTGTSSTTAYNTSARCQWMASNRSFLARPARPRA